MDSRACCTVPMFETPDACTPCKPYATGCGLFSRDSGGHRGLIHLRVNCMSGETIVTLTVATSLTISELKELIAQRSDFRHGIVVENLNRGDKTLLDVMSLLDAALVDGDTLLATCATRLSGSFTRTEVWCAWNGDRLQELSNAQFFPDGSLIVSGMSAFGQWGRLSDFRCEFKHTVVDVRQHGKQLQVFLELVGRRCEGYRCQERGAFVASEDGEDNSIGTYHGTLYVSSMAPSDRRLVIPELGLRVWDVKSAWWKKYLEFWQNWDYSDELLEWEWQEQSETQSNFTSRSLKWYALDEDAWPGRVEPHRSSEEKSRRSRDNAFQMRRRGGYNQEEERIHMNDERLQNRLRKNRSQTRRLDRALRTLATGVLLSA